MFDDKDDLTEPLTEADAQARVAKRCTYLYQAFGLYNKKLIAAGLNSAVMNKALLVNAVESYFLDIHRLKTFHGMERADRYKIAGYFLKWLCKIKPIQVGPLGNQDPKLQKHGILVNADFAVIHALVVAKVDQESIDQRLVTSLLYSAHYRDLDAGVMAVAMESLARAYPRPA